MNAASKLIVKQNKKKMAANTQTIMITDYNPGRKRNGRRKRRRKFNGRSDTDINLCEWKKYNIYIWNK